MEIEPTLIQSDTLLRQVVELLREMNTPAYLVGGAVRDRLLAAGAEPARPAYDLDFTVPDDGLRLARHIADVLGVAFYPLDRERGVGRVVLAGPPRLPGTDSGPDPHFHPESSGWSGMIRIIDVARFQGPGLEADLAGRDFTVNAMALEVTRDPPRLIDPHDGRADLAARRLRAVSDRSIRNDPVRGLRGVRLAAQLGFEIEPRTRSLIQAAAAGLALVSAERIQEELVKILSTPGVAHSLRELDELGLLPEVLPEVSALKGVAQSRPHRWNAYEHTLQVVVALEDLLPLEGDRFHTDVPFPDRVARHLSTPVAGGGSRRTLLSLAGLLHDVGKRETAAVEPDGRTRFFNHERVGADMAAGMMRRLRFSGESLRLVETIVLYHLRPLQLAWAGGASRRAIHRLFCDAGDAGVEIVLLSLADHRATVGPGALDEEYPVLLEVVRALLEAYFHRQATVVSPPPLLTGRDLLRRFNLPPGPDIGRLLNELKEAQAAGEVTTREEAEDWVRRKIG